ncbi:MAG TPA: response regulator transcription factor [Leucothrix mucor]|uniref:Response regulator transcription factor n=1 Tax=Leucothrix mucor TaxID=45248 RepID=A0A7V2SYR7_LEUMU|nr:response regulator transcription factor [Leucothrix mucor]
MTHQLQLVISDPQATSATLCKNYLEKHAIQVRIATSLETLKVLLKEKKADILLFDLCQPDGDGMRFIQNIGLQSSMGIIVFTHEFDPLDKLISLETCADDYIQKPCNFREVVARIRAVHRRIQSYKQQDNINFYCKGFIMDCLSRSVTLDSGRKLNLTRYEFDMLKVLIECKNQPVSRQKLLNAVSYQSDINQLTYRSVDSVIYRLRNKMPDKECIKTLYGVGYTFEESVFDYSVTESPIKKLRNIHTSTVLFNKTLHRLVSSNFEQLSMDLSRSG